MGTPDFAVPTLAALLESRHEVVGVVTQPDRPKGRSGKLQPSPVKEKALEADVPVLQPEKVKDPAALSPDILFIIRKNDALPLINCIGILQTVCLFDLFLIGKIMVLPPDDLR